MKTDPNHPINLKNLTKSELKIWADAQQIPALVDDPSLFFILDDLCVQMTEITKLNPRVPPENDPRSVDRAMVLAHAASQGFLPKRKPLTVRLNPDGNFTILDGTSTYGAAIRAGWKRLPVIIEK
jgi:hypothetical protein